MDLEAGDDKARARAMEKVEKVLGLHEAERASRASIVHEQYRDDPGAIDVLGLLGIEPVIPKGDTGSTNLGSELGAAPLPIESATGRAVAGGIEELRDKA